MTALDVTLRPMAARLIANYGKSVIYTHKAPGTYDPTAGDATSSACEECVQAVVTDYTSAEKLAPGVRDGDLKVLIADVLSSPPVPNDTITLDCRTLEVVNATTVYTGELAGLWQLQARQG